jgi:hypothetical protein
VKREEAPALVRIGILIIAETLLLPKKCKVSLAL